MAKIRVDLAETLVDGMDIKFKAPCACNEITGLIVYYPAEDETMKSKELVFRDAHGNDLTGIGNLFSKDAYVKILVDSENGYAYLQNADNNGYLNSAILGTYLHDAENLIGSGENGKFKATVTGTVSSIKVNGVSCSVKCGEDSSMDLIAGCWYTFIRDGNTVNFNTGGAGAGLNFKVVGGTTKPVSPKENTIWINTNTEITDYIFRGTEPVDATPGLVWIKTGVVGRVEFNALKKGGIQINPILAKQYVSGAWVKKSVKSYQSGNWVDWWNGEFFQNGSFYTEHSEYKNPSTATITVENDAIILSTVANKASEVYKVFGPVALDDVKTLSMTSTFTDKLTTAAHRRVLYVAASPNVSRSGAAAIKEDSVRSNFTAATTTTLDVSTLTGDYYVYAGTNTDGSAWEGVRVISITSVMGEVAE